MTMRLSTVSQQLIDTRNQIEGQCYREGKQISPACVNFMKEICALVPSDLLLATNLFWSPKMIYGGDSTKLTRYHDIHVMAARINLWYEFNLPQENDTNTHEISVLMELKSWFTEIDAVANELIETTELSASQGASDSSCCDRDCRCRSKTAQWCEICAYCTLYGCYGCVRCLIEVESQFHINQGIAAGASGGAYTGGVTGVVTGEWSRYLSASSVSHCHSCCKDSCGSDFADICCYCALANHGTAAAVSGGSAPDNCCGQLAYHLTNSVTDMRGCYCKCFNEVGKICCTVSSGSGDICSGLYRGFLQMMRGTSRCIARGSLCKELGHICDFDCWRFESKYEQKTERAHHKIVTCCYLY